MGDSIRRRIEALEARRNPRGLRVPQVLLCFMESDGEGGLAATGHAQAVLGSTGLGPLEPYRLSPEEEAARQQKLEAWQAEEAKRKRDNLMRVPPKGTVQ